MEGVKAHYASFILTKNMTAEQFQEIESKGGSVDLSDRAKFRLTGVDRVRYLNGQVTNDVRVANGREALYACVTDIKGRIVGDVMVHAAQQGDALFFDAEPALREILGPRLERYIIADDVELSDVSEGWQLWHVFGPAARTFLAGAGEAGVLKSNRLGLEGADIWLPASAPRPTFQCPLLGAEDFETYRIVRGIPRFPNELNADAFPPEAGLDDRAMSYTKGCYIGQEILSRIRTTGKMPRELVRWEMTESGGVVSVGDSLFSADDADANRVVGKVTSVTKHPLLERFVGLAYLKQGFAGVDSELPVGSDTPRIGPRVKISPVVKQ